MTPALLTITSASLFALALLMIAGVVLAREIRRSRSSSLIQRAILNADADLAGFSSEADDAAAEAIAKAKGATPKEADQPMALPLHWLDSRLGKALVADEDRRLIDQCGFSSQRAQLIFLVSRVLLALLLPLASWMVMGSGDAHLLPAICIAFVAGFMGPKWLLRRRAGTRRAIVSNELPLLVDLLRLLQGVGLSLDQTLHVITEEFASVLPVLGNELILANRQYSQGRSRERSLHRLADLYDNEQLAGLVSLMVQVDRHGGAVQEPLRMFSDRLREHRRAEMKEKIGKITVKMTVIMIGTLLPALIIVTAGPGFLAVVRSLGSIAK